MRCSYNAPPPLPSMLPILPSPLLYSISPPLPMAFSNYSNLFRCGLLSEDSPTHGSAPWATEYYGPRRGSLPTIDTFSDKSDVLTLQQAPMSSCGHDTIDSSTGEEALYFTFKKKRNPAEHRSFLSLDLAESQSLRSLSIKGKENAVPRSEGARRVRPPGASPSYNHSYVQFCLQ